MYNLYIWDKKTGIFVNENVLYSTKREAKKGLKKIMDIINHVAFSYPQYVEQGDVYYKIEKLVNS